MSTELQHAQSLDAADPLASFRDRFIITDPNLIYLDGNSLGRLPKATEALFSDLLADWGDRLIRIWGEKYLTISQDVGAKIAKLLGAQPDEIIVAESTSVNMFKLFVAALQLQTGRKRIVTDDLNFPSDLYVLQEIQHTLGNQHELAVVKSPDGVTGPVDGIKAQLDSDAALLTLTHTVFKSAYTYDMAAMTALAKDAGALTVWDLSHSAGSVPIDLNGSGAEMAIGCTYKYLNGGPGSPAFLYVSRELQEKLRNPIAGWMGQKNQFDFGLQYQAADGIGRFLTGTPTVMSIAPISIGVDLLNEAGMERVRAKSLAQTDYLIELWEKHLQPLGFSLKSPRDGQWRGSHVALGHPDAWRISQSLVKDQNVIPDFRAPDNIRLGVTPLYTSFVDLYEAVLRIKQIMEEKLYARHSAEMSAVT